MIETMDLAHMEGDVVPPFPVRCLAMWGFDGC